MSKIVWTSLIIIITICSVFIGIYLYKNINKQSTDLSTLQKVEDECTIEGELYKLGLLENYVEANASEEKVGPNTVLEMKKFYLNCKHAVTEKVELPKEIINMTKEQLEKEYKDWMVEEFSAEKVVLYKEYRGICNEHYLVKNTGEVLGIYTLDENGKENLKEKTEIYTKYLPENDVSRLEEGIEVIGRENLNSFLEDYE